MKSQPLTWRIKWKSSQLNRWQFLACAGAFTASALLPVPPVLAQSQKIRVGLMLPYTGTYAQLGTAITNGFKLAVTERGGKLAGRELEYFTVDDEAEPAKAPENANKLVQRDKVDVLVGTVHSGVQMGMVKDRKETGTPADHSQRRARCRHRGRCARRIFSHLILQLAAVLSDGQSTWPIAA